MEITTRLTSSFLDVKVNEIETTIWTNGNESLEFAENLVGVLKDLASLRDESVYEMLEYLLDIKIKFEED